MTQKRFTLIEEALTPEDMVGLALWAISTSAGTRNTAVDREAVRIVLMKLWDRFDQDLVNDWCESLVAAKLAGAAE